MELKFKKSLSVLVLLVACLSLNIFANNLVKNLTKVEYIKWQKEAVSFINKDTVVCNDLDNAAGFYNSMQASDYNRAKQYIVNSSCMYVREYRLLSIEKFYPNKISAVWIDYSTDISLTNDDGTQKCNSKYMLIRQYVYTPYIHDIEELNHLLVDGKK